MTRPSWGIAPLMAILVVGVMIGSAVPQTGTPIWASHPTPGALGPILGVGTSAVSAGLTASAGSAAPAHHPKNPTGNCGIATWCAPALVQGQFYSSTGVPLAPTGSRPCSIPTVLGVCTEAAGFGAKSTTVSPYVNATNDPSINLTSTGMLALAYTEYTTQAPTGAGPCSGRLASTSEVAVETSSNNGGTWSTPVLVGVPDCASAAKYGSAWEPAITSLGNGTLVMVYVQYTATAPNVPPFISPASPPLSRLVVTMSYPGSGFGTTWTQPTVLNVSNPNPSITVSFAPVRPSIAAHGKTVYVTWMNLGSTVAPEVFSYVSMVVSTSNGKSWSPTIRVSNANTFSANPNVLVNPVTGELFIAYVTSVTWCNTVYASVTCSVNVAKGTPWTGSVVVAHSSANGTAFTTTTAASGLRLNASFGPFFNPTPQLAWGSTSSILSLAFTAGISTLGERGTIGSTISGAAIDPVLYYYHAVVATNISAFSMVLAPSAETAVINYPISIGGLTNSSRIVNVAAAPFYTNNFTVEVTYYNGTACAPTSALQTTCGMEMTAVLGTTNNGTSWSGPHLLSGALQANGSQTGGTTFDVNGTLSGWHSFLTGEYMAAISYGTTNLYAWSRASCPSWSGSGNLTPVLQCGSFVGPGGTPTWTLWGTTDVTVSSPSSGSTTSVTFSPQNATIDTLPGTAPWTLWFMGQGYHVGNGSANITVTNVPVGTLMVWNFSTVGSYNSTSKYFGGTALSSVVSPAAFSGATTVGLSFIELVPITLQATPSSLNQPNCSPSYVPLGCPQYWGQGPNMGDFWTTSTQLQTFSAYNPWTCGYMYQISTPNLENYACANPPAGISTSAYYYTYNCISEMYAYLYGSAGYATTLASVANIYEMEWEIYGAGCADGYVELTHGTTTTVATYGVPLWVRTGTSYTFSEGTWNPWGQLCGQPYQTIGYPGWLQSAASGTSGFSFWYIYCDGVSFDVVTPLAWLGQGNGSATSTNSTIAVQANGPVTETIDWLVNWVCSASYMYDEVEYSGSTLYGPYGYNSSTCVQPSGGGGGGGASGTPIPVKVTETGLPKGTPWSVVLTNSAGAPTIFGNSSSATQTLQPWAGYTYSVYVAPTPIPKLAGEYWIGTSSNATITSPDFYGVTISYAMGTYSGINFAATVTATGLPSGASWSLNETNLSSTPVKVSTHIFPPGSVATAQVYQLFAGDKYQFNGSAVYEPNGTGYYVTQITVAQEGVNQTAVNGLPGSTTIVPVGPMSVTLQFSPEYRVSVTSSSGGTVTPSVGGFWVPLSGKVNLTATPGACGSQTCQFVTWTGTGIGSQSGAGSGTNHKLTLTVGGAITEFAAFRSPLAPTWTVTVKSSGAIPQNQSYTLLVNGAPYTGIGTFTIGNLTTGSYTFSAPTAYSQPNVSVAYIPGTVATSLGPGPTISVSSNVTVTVPFTSLYQLRLSAPVGGTITSSTGAKDGAWLTPGTSETLTAVATPRGGGLPGYHFVQWLGTGSGSYSGNNTTIAVTMVGPVSEVAVFSVNPVPPPATYWLAVSESGLPSNLLWNATVGVAGASNSTTTLTLQDLNGTYTLVVPTVYQSSEVRYVPDGKVTYSATTTVTSNRTVSVTFTKQLLVTIQVTGSGAVTGGAGGWYNDSTTLNLEASASTGWSFSGWSGSATQSEAALTLNVSAPLTVTATFVPIQPQVTHVNNNDGVLLDFGLLLPALLVVGLIIGLLVGMAMRKRKPSGGSKETESMSREASSRAQEETMSAASGEERPMETADREASEPSVSELTDEMPMESETSSPPTADMNEDGEAD